MDLKTQLLQERARVLTELRDIESLLKSRCGWSPPQTTSAQSSEPSKEEIQASMEQFFSRDPEQGIVPPVASPAGTHNDLDPAMSIAYAREAELWLDEEPRKEFTVGHFEHWLHNKFGEENVNYKSVRGPFKKLEESGRVVVVRPGSGRAPTIFRKATQPSVMADDEF